MRKVIQKDYKKFNNDIYNFWNENRRMPNFKEMGQMFGVSSTDTVHRIVNDLVNMGHILKDDTGKIIPVAGYIFVKKTIQKSIKLKNIEKTKNNLQKIFRINNNIENLENVFIFQSKENHEELGIIAEDYIFARKNKELLKNNLIIIGSELKTFEFEKDENQDFLTVISIIRNY